MTLVRVINKFLLYLHYLLKFKSHRVAFYFAHYNLSLASSKNISSRQGNLFFINTGNQIDKKCVHNFKGEYAKLAFCLNDNRVKVVSTKENSFTVLIDGIRLNINSASNIVTLYELYFETLYNILNLDEEIVVVDIGMNVGFAALFFAKHFNVAAIHCFEPFKETFDEADRNLDLNPGLKTKINANNYGISDYEGIISVPQMQSGDGGASVNKDILKENNTQHLPHTKVEVKDITGELEKIMLKNPNHSLLLKIDCEGEEYQIFEKLKNSDLFDNVIAFIIEWHFKGFDPIAEILRNHGYKILSLPKADNSSGMLYAFK